MRGVLLTLNDSFFFLVASIYLGAMWTVRLFFYPSWNYMSAADVPHHFVIPVKAATKFFTIVLPLMLLAGVVMVVEEWGKAQLWQAIVAVAGITASALAFELLIKPINTQVYTADDATLTPLLQKWMRLNEIRFVASTITWLATIWFFIGRGHLTQLLKH